jgi:mRNA-degrading endonuclease YafQ of YafQ-DinJ toxin-antitoxin module
MAYVIHTTIRKKEFQKALKNLRKKQSYGKKEISELFELLLPDDMKITHVDDLELHGTMGDNIEFSLREPIVGRDRELRFSFKGYKMNPRGIVEGLREKNFEFLSITPEIKANKKYRRWRSLNVGGSIAFIKRFLSIEVGPIYWAEVPSVQLVLSGDIYDEEAQKVISLIEEKIQAYQPRRTVEQKL